MEYRIHTIGKIEDFTLREKLNELNELFFRSKEKVAYYYEDMETHTIFSYNSEVLFYAASTIKILVCVLLIEQAEEGQLDLNEKILISMEDLKQDTGILKYQKEPTHYTLRELIRLTLVESDNTAYIKLVNFIGKENLISYGKQLGAMHTLEGKDLFGVINCEDLLCYWKKIYSFVRTSIYGPMLEDWLKNPSFHIIESESFDGQPFVKKYGSWDIAYHEAGYILDSHPFYFILLTQKCQCLDKESFANEVAKRVMDLHHYLYQ